MSDDDLPDNDQGHGTTEEDGADQIEDNTPRFFDDGLETPPSLHAAATRASVEELSLVEDGPSEPGESPIAFPLPIELGLFHGVAELTPGDKGEGSEDAFPSSDNVISLLPRPRPRGAIWDLKPAGEETVREEFDHNEPLTPPEPALLQGAVEAILFASDKPLTLAQINQYLANPGTSAVREALYDVQTRFRRPGSGIRLVEVAKGWQFRTDLRAARYVSSMRGEQPFKLSKAAIETLSIVAYRQPVTRAEVEDLRGVDPGGILRMLSERGLIAVTGRKDEPGRPLLYGTTPDFLSLFGLRDLSELPTLRDLRELQQDDAREGIGSTDDDVHTALVDALTPHDAPPPTPIQELLPLEPID